MSWFFAGFKIVSSTTKTQGMTDTDTDTDTDTHTHWCLVDASQCDPVNLCPPALYTAEVFFSSPLKNDGWKTTAFFWEGQFSRGSTLPETNVASENGPSQKEMNLPTMDFQGLR